MLCQESIGIIKSFILVGNICLSLACRLWPTLYGPQSNENFSFLISCNANLFCFSFSFFFKFYLAFPLNSFRNNFGDGWYFHGPLGGVHQTSDMKSASPDLFSSHQCQWVFYTVFADASGAGCLVFPFVNPLPTESRLYLYLLVSYVCWQLQIVAVSPAQSKMYDKFSVYHISSFEVP